MEWGRQDGVGSGLCLHLNELQLESWGSPVIKRDASPSSDLLGLASCYFEKQTGFVFCCCCFVLFLNLECGRLITGPLTTASAGYHRDHVTSELAHGPLPKSVPISFEYCREAVG